MKVSLSELKKRNFSSCFVASVFQWSRRDWLQWGKNTKENEEKFKLKIVGVGRRQRVKDWPRSYKGIFRKASNTLMALESIRHSVAAAAAKSLRSCPTLCYPIDSSPPGSPVPGLLQARTLEWVAISFSNAGKWKVKVKSLSRVRLLVTPWTAAYQAPPSMGFSRQEYWSGCHCLLHVWVLGWENSKNGHNSCLNN